MSRPEHAYAHLQPGLRAGSVAMVGAVALAVAGAMQLAGLVERWNQSLADVFGGMMQESLTQQLPTWFLWLASGLVAFGLPLVLLPIECGWRRWTVWLMTCGLMALWAPVLGLAAHRPDLVTPWVTTVVSGLLVLLCAGRGRCDGKDAL